ncbi:hypothetical protein V5799_029594 [Amblyomma americanum]|uniref:Uncharacterized protein n=1 Tax=Amblyomma americanum TaxID=6943 RepID=A0AAQ4ERA9_AMBAM
MSPGCLGLSFRLDIGNDENVWSTLLATTAINIYRTSFDQVVVQRYIASRTLKEARRTAVVGLVLTTFMYLAEAAMALALTLWFRGCDPESMGQIQKLDQILPFYVKTYLVQFPGTVGLFLSGIVSAATSTISSLINSQAAILYVDVVSPQLPISEVHVARITKCIAFVVGVVMTIYSTLVPYMGSITRIFMMANAAISGPLAGLMLMAVIFPFVNAKGAGWATLLAVVYQLWHMWQTLMSDAKPPRMDVTTDFCADNISRLAPLPTPPQESSSSLPALGISSYWSSFFSTIATIVIGLLISALTGGRRSCRKNIPYTNTTCLILWERAGLLPSEVQVKTACSEDTKEGSLMLDTHQEDIAANNETGV